MLCREYIFCFLQVASFVYLKISYFTSKDEILSKKVKKETNLWIMTPHCNEWVDIKTKYRGQGDHLGIEFPETINKERLIKYCINKLMKQKIKKWCTKRHQPTYNNQLTKFSHPVSLSDNILVGCLIGLSVGLWGRRAEGDQPINWSIGKHQIRRSIGRLVSRSVRQSVSQPVGQLVSWKFTRKHLCWSFFFYKVAGLWFLRNF